MRTIRKCLARYDEISFTVKTDTVLRIHTESSEDLLALTEGQTLKIVVQPSAELIEDEAGETTRGISTEILVDADVTGTSYWKASRNTE